ncbi:MAG: hypothetical protein ABUS79_03990 [Pseudomonadota bacterium]
MKASVDAAAEASVDAVTVVDVAAEAGLTMVNYRLTSVVGTFSGDGVNVQPTRTDTLAPKTCTFTSTGTAANQMARIGVADLIKPLSVTGTWSCPAGMATSTGSPSTCAIAATSGTTNMLQASVEAAGWTDDAVVTIKIAYPPGVITACNYATVVVNAPGWQMTGTTTAGKFKALTPFTVPVMGAKVLTSGTTTSNVAWDFMMTIEPSP